MATSTLGLIPNWYPPNREHYDLILSLWKWFPAFASLQWLTTWYGMGKTSLPSPFNLPGRIAWLTMESPGFLTLLYTFFRLPPQLSLSDLPWQNSVLAGLFVIHYTYRAILFPFLQPSMAPMHLSIWASAFGFQVINGLMLGSWLAGYGPTTQQDWDKLLPFGGTLQFTIGIALFYVGLAANYYHDDELREIRRRENHRQDRLVKEGKVKRADVTKHYEVPKAGLFKYMLYPHYLVEWVEWFGYWTAAGYGCVPARCFLFNEIASMLPRAVRGKGWYVEKFGEEKVGGKWAVIPGVW